MQLIHLRRIMLMRKINLRGDLQEISSVTKAYVEYKRVNVLIFMNKSEDIEFQVYDGTTRNDDYSIAPAKAV